MSNLTATGMYCAWKGIPVPGAEVITDCDPGDEHVPARPSLARPPTPIGAADPNRSSIAAHLRDIADGFERGQLSGIALTVLYGDGNVGTLVDFAVGHEQPFYLLGAVESMKVRIHAQIEEG